MENKREKSRKTRNFLLKYFLYFIIFELFFTVATAPFIIFHGPFKNVKKDYGRSSYDYFKTSIYS